MKKFSGILFLGGLSLLILLVIGNALFSKKEKESNLIGERNDNDEPPSLYEKLEIERERDNPKPCPEGHEPCHYEESTLL